METYRKLKYILVIILFLLIKFSGIGESAGTSAGVILNYLPGPRINALADAGTSLSGDFSASSWNPAILGTVNGLTISALYYSAFEDSKVGYIGLGKKVGPGYLALKGIFYLGGDITIKDYQEPELNKKTITAQQDIIFSLGYGFKLTKNFNAGFNAKYYVSTLIEDYKASSYVIDAGLLYETGIFKTGDLQKRRGIKSRGLNFGVSVLNVGQKISYSGSSAKDPLPLMYRLGLSYPLNFSGENGILITGDALYDNEKNIKGGVGIEYSNNDLLFLRTGYKVNYEIKHFTCGLGLKYNKFKIDYSLGVNTAINSEHNIMLTFNPTESSKKNKKYRVKRKKAKQIHPKKMKRKKSKKIKF